MLFRSAKNSGKVTAHGTTKAKGFGAILGYAESAGKVTLKKEAEAVNEWVKKDAATKPYLYNNIGGYVEGQADLLGVGREPGQVDHFGEQVVEVVLLGLDGLDFGAGVGQEAVGEFQRTARLAGQLVQTGATLGAVGGGAQFLDDGQDGGLEQAQVMRQEGEGI